MLWLRDNQSMYHWNQNDQTYWSPIAEQTGLPEPSDLRRLKISMLPHFIKPINTLAHGKQMQPDSQRCVKEPKEALAASRAVDWVRDTGSVIYRQRGRRLGEINTLLQSHACCRLIRSEALRNVLNYLWLLMAHPSDWLSTHSIGYFVKRRGRGGKPHTCIQKGEWKYWLFFSVTLAFIMHSQTARSASQTVWDVNTSGWKSHVSLISRPSQYTSFDIMSLWWI